MNWEEECRALRQEVRELRAEIERLRAALEEIAQAPERHPDGDWSASSLIEIAHAALTAAKHTGG